MKDKVVYQLKDKAIWVVFVILVVAFTVANPRFINPNNLLMMLRQVAILGIASIRHPAGRYRLGNGFHHHIC